MSLYLLDTNHLGPALSRVSRVRDQILQACKKGDRFATCWPVLCELEAGIVSTKNPARNRRVLHDLLEHIVIWPQDWDVVTEYGKTSKLLAERGRVLSPVDLTLVALALVHNATVLSTDLDFLSMPEIHVVNWC
jgi:predicted nucleic acid-binding protein